MIFKNKFIIPIFYVLFFLIVSLGSVFLPEKVNIDNLTRIGLTGPDTLYLSDLANDYKELLTKNFYQNYNAYAFDNSEIVSYGFVGYLFKINNPLLLIVSVNFVLYLISYFFTLFLLPDHKNFSTFIRYFIYFNPILLTAFCSIGKDASLLMFLQAILLVISRNKNFLWNLPIIYAIYKIRDLYFVFISSFLFLFKITGFLLIKLKGKLKIFSVIAFFYLITSAVCFYFHSTISSILASRLACVDYYGGGTFLNYICNYLEKYSTNTVNTTTVVSYSENFFVFLIQMVTNSFFSPIFSIKILNFTSAKKIVFLIICIIHRLIYLGILYKLFKRNPNWVITVLFIFLEMMVFYITRNYGTALRVVFPWQCFLILFLYVKQSQPSDLKSPKAV